MNRTYLLAARWFFVLVLAVAVSPALGQCGQGEPAYPVPECRSQNDPANESCDAADALRLWPRLIRPGNPGEGLPEERDSTQWDSRLPAYSGTGLELFQSLDVVDDRLFVAYNSGIQVWDVAGAQAESPLLLDFRDGYLAGHFLHFSPFGENDFWIEDIAAIRAPDGSDDVWLAVSGRRPAGLTLWRFRAGSFEQLYQESGLDTRQVRIAEAGGRVYALGATSLGVFVWDVSAAAELTSPCLDLGGLTCPEIHRGRVGTMTSGLYLDILARDDKIYVAAGDASGLFSQPLAVDLWELADPAAPETAIRRFAGAGLSSAIFAPTLFEHRGQDYLALIENATIKIFALGDCLSAGCDSLGAPVWSPPSPLPQVSASSRFLTFSSSMGQSFLYFGFESPALEGGKIEQLLDLQGLGTTNQVVEVTGDGASYVDPCNGLEVDYWGDYYPRNNHGFANVSPRSGKFNGLYFYRAAKGILDVHVRTDSIFLDGFESGSSAAWDGDP